jgi:hypothetical protein
MLGLVRRWGNKRLVLWFIFMHGNYLCGEDYEARLFSYLVTSPNYLAVLFPSRLLQIRSVSTVNHRCLLCSFGFSEIAC